MMRDVIGPIANAIVRQIVTVARIGGADRQKPILVVEDVRVVDWASLTFEGQRHSFELRLEGDAAAVADALALIEAKLAECDIPLGRSFVAEICVVAGSCASLPTGGVAQQLCVEALTIRD